MLHITNHSVAILFRSIGQTMYTNIDHDGIGFDHIGSNELGLAYSYNQDIGLTGKFGKILCTTVTHGNCAVKSLARQEIGNWCSNDI